MSTNSSRRLSRRDFLKMTAGVAGGLALSSCAPAATPEPEVAPPEAPPAEPVTVRMITHWAGEDAHTETMQLLYQRFQEANPDIVLDIVEIPDWPQADAKVQPSAGRGTAPTSRSTASTTRP